MLFRLLLLFVLVPVVELALLIRLGDVIGLWPTLALIILTGIIGSSLAKQQGFSVLRRVQNQLNQGKLPGNELLDGAIILISGALLLTPGVITDLSGIIGLIPLTRRPIRKWLIRRFKRSKGGASFRIFWGGNQPSSHSPYPPQHESEEAEEAPYEVIDEKAEDNSKSG